MDFVTSTMLSFDGHHSGDDGKPHPRSSGRKRRIEIPDSDDEWGETRRKKAKPVRKRVSFEIQDSEDEEGLPSGITRKSERPSDFERKRQETLTQMDFAKLLRGEMADAEDEIEIPESDDVMVVEDTTNVAEDNEPAGLAQAEPEIKQTGASPERIVSSYPADSDPLPTPKPILRTPKKSRGKDVIPSSQSPAESTLSTQKTPRIERSPLANRSAVAEQRIDSPANPRSAASPLQERSPNVRRLSISPTKFHVRQFIARMAENLKPTPQSKIIRSSAESSEAKDLLEDEENKAPCANETCFDVGLETQAVLISSALSCEENQDPENSSLTDEEKISESPVKVGIVEATGEVHEIADELQAGIPTSQYPDARSFWQHEPSWRPESTDTYFDRRKEANTQDSASAQLYRETQAYNERITSSQDEETERVPSSQETPMPPPSIHTTQFQQSSVRLLPESQQSTIGTSLVLTPRRSQRFLQSSQSKQSVIETPSSPSKKSTVVIPSSPSVQRMGPPPAPASSQVTPKTRRVRDLRMQLLEHDYEDDPVSVSQLLGETMGESIAMPPLLSSPTDAE